MSRRWFGRAAIEVAKHPALWLTAVAQVVRLAPRRWWRESPYLPVPDRDYLRFRLQTQYGDPDRAPEPSDVVAYLKWCRGYGRLSG